MLHIDAFEAPKFDRPGHWAHGDRSEPTAPGEQGQSHRCHRRPHSLGLRRDPPAENKHTVSATLRRAAAWKREQGTGPVQAVMSDNAKCYAVSDEFRATLAKLGARHILIPPRTPRWNGRVKRICGALDREWAPGRVSLNRTRGDRALSSFIRFYNRRRPHSACGGRPLISHVHQLRGQNR